MITCRLLGPVELTVDGGPPPPELLWRKNLALLVYLARSPKRTRTRDHLTGLLWADKTDASARHSLREAIRVLRRTLDEGALSTEHDQVRLANESVHLDTEQFDAYERAGDWQSAAALVAGEFLEGFGVPGASAFEDWLTAERQDWRRRRCRVLVLAADDLLTAGHAREAADLALQALGTEPGHDGAMRAALRSLALAGDRMGALDRYQEFAAHLAEAGTEPEPDTQTLAGRVRGERAWRLSDQVPTRPEQGAELRRAPLVGRDQLLTQLGKALAATVGDRRAGVCMVTGDPGLGKSRLLEELVGRARLDGAAVAAVRAVPSDHEAAWSGVLGLARGGLLAARGVPAASPSALAAFSGVIPQWADRFGAPQSEPAPLGTAFSNIVHAAADEQPVVLIADDAHWLDHESLGALLAVPRDHQALPVAVVLAAQPEPARDELDDLRARIGRDVPGVALRLTPLAEDDLRHLARWAVPGYTEDEIDRLARRVAVDSAGLPLLAVELLHAVALGLDLGTITGAWPEPHQTLDQTLPGDLPDTIVAAIRIGFRRLTKDAQRILAAAAVLGDQVTPARLERAAAVTHEPLLAALDELEWQRWLTADARGYSFVARIVRDVVARDMLTQGQRRRIVEADRAAP